MKVRSETGDTVAEFSSISRVSDKIVVDAKLLGSMRMDLVLTFEDILDAMKLFFSWGVISYVLLVPCFVVRRLFRKIQFKGKE
ncbi:MAG: hypothetical protein D4R82_02690 [Dehalococcoidia bacterium]|nr:MAG: hypothetical protein D4R82_02690 [Dehalococcoidia bacterium]